MPLAKNVSTNRSNKHIEFRDTYLIESHKAKLSLTCLCNFIGGNALSIGTFHTEIFRITQVKKENHNSIENKTHLLNLIDM